MCVGRGQAALYDLAEQSFARYMKALTVLVATVEHALPDVAEPALVQARRVWVDRAADPATLLPYRLACWAFLEQKGSGSVPRDTEDHAVRALLCCLYIDDEGDLGMSVEFASDMLTSLGIDDAEVVSTVRGIGRS